jgi:D-alanine-D-alanine ligase
MANNIKNIAVLAGGYSSEYKISINSARQVMNHLNRKRYQPYLILITQDGWFWETTNGEKIQVDKNAFTLKTGNKSIFFDGAFIVIHGSPGEDGKLQSYFEMIGIPYTGCSSFTSALTFNKFACKLFLEKYNIPTAPSVLVRKTAGWTPPDLGEMIYPLFIKPNASGSSFGVSKVYRPSEVAPAIRKAFKESDEVIIEEFIEGTEVSCGVLKTSTRDIIFPPTEIVSHNEFFDYQAKYSEGMAEEITPARLPENRITLIQETASSIYSILGCRGIARIDFILKEHTPYFLEINTIPGLSKESIIPRQAAVFGISMDNLTDMILEDIFV